MKEAPPLFEGRGLLASGTSPRAESETGVRVAVTRRSRRKRHRHRRSWESESEGESEWQWETEAQSETQVQVGGRSPRAETGVRVAVTRRSRRKRRRHRRSCESESEGRVQSGSGRRRRSRRRRPRSEAESEAEWKVRDRSASGESRVAVGDGDAVGDAGPGPSPRPESEVRGPRSEVRGPRSELTEPPSGPRPDSEAGAIGQAGCRPRPGEPVEHRADALQLRARFGLEVKDVKDGEHLPRRALGNGEVVLRRPGAPLALPSFRDVDRHAVGRPDGLVFHVGPTGGPGDARHGVVDLDGEPVDVGVFEGEVVGLHEFSQGRRGFKAGSSLVKRAGRRNPAGRSTVVRSPPEPESESEARDPGSPTPRGPSPELTEARADRGPS